MAHLQIQLLDGSHDQQNHLETECEMCLQFLLYADQGKSTVVIPVNRKEL
jgi:hypothetical protein